MKSKIKLYNKKQALIIIYLKYKNYLIVKNFDNLE